MATRQPQRISKRVLNQWELLVYRAKMAAERRAIDDPQGPWQGSASNTTVPQTLLQQANIDAILQTADELTKEDPHVARICTFKLIFFPRFALTVVVEYKQQLEAFEVRVSVGDIKF